MAPNLNDKLQPEELAEIYTGRHDGDADASAAAEVLHVSPTSANWMKDHSIHVVLSSVLRSAASCLPDLLCVAGGRITSPVYRLESVDRTCTQLVATRLTLLIVPQAITSMSLQMRWQRRTISPSMHVRRMARMAMPGW